MWLRTARLAVLGHGDNPSERHETFKMTQSETETLLDDIGVPAVPRPDGAYFLRIVRRQYVYLRQDVVP